ncbi:MAG: glycosyltransferase [Gemmataceae bacterium]
MHVLGSFWNAFTKAASSILPRWGPASARQREHRRLVARIRKVVDQAVPPEATVIVVSNGDDSLLELDGRRAWHFPQMVSRVYAQENPFGSTAAVAHLESLRAKGGDFLLVPRTVLWWLDGFRKFRQHLEQRYRLAVSEEDACVIFALRQPALPGAFSWSAEFDELIAKCERRLDSEPSILDWNTDLQLASVFPRHSVFSPDDPGCVLPYLDHSVDIVALPASDSSSLSEARRVARTAVATFTRAGNGPDQIIAFNVEWDSSPAEAEPPTTSIIIPCHNGAFYTKTCLAAIEETLPAGFRGEIIVVDDASTDETPSVLKRWAALDPSHRVLHNPVNAGFVYSCNRAAATATGEILVFLNNDTIPLPGWLPPLLATFRAYADAGAIGGKLIYPDGRLQEAGAVVFSDGSGANFGRGDRDVDAPLYNYVREVDYCSGALLATKRRLFVELGGFDERYRPAYYEDADFCFKLRESGHRVHYQPEANVIHFEGATAGNDVTRAVKRYQQVNQAKFTERWSGALKRQPPPVSRFDVATWHALADRSCSGTVGISSSLPRPRGRWVEGDADHAFVRSPAHVLTQSPGGAPADLAHFADRATETCLFEQFHCDATESQWRGDTTPPKPAECGPRIDKIAPNQAGPAPRALVCAPKIPEADRDCGSRRILDLIVFLRDAGWAVTFVAKTSGQERYVKSLQQRGIKTYIGSDSRFEELVRVGHFDLAILAFWNIAESCLPALRALSPGTRVVVDSIDLHFLRNARRHFLKPAADGAPGMLPYHYESEIRRELNTYAAGDAVLAVSQKEADLINDFVCDPTLAYSLPLGEALAASPVPFAERKGILFVGNFRHTPNGEAVKYLCQEIVPRLDPALLADHPVSIIGNALNGTVQSYGDNMPQVRMVGWVPSVQPYFERARVSVAPLLHGAGTKGKLLQTLMIGTPAVSTSIGAEGLHLRDSEHILIANNAVAFAASISRLLLDAELWQRLARQGQAHIAAVHSREAVRERFLQAISAVLAKQPKLSAATENAVANRRDTASEEYLQLIGRIRQLICAKIPPKATVLVVSRGDEDLLQLGERQAWHFPRTDGGAYAGHHPANSAAAIAHLEALRAKGAEFLLFPKTALWWLEYYLGFKKHLEQRYSKLVDHDEACVIFALRLAADGRATKE